MYLKDNIQLFRSFTFNRIFNVFKLYLSFILSRITKKSLDKMVSFLQEMVNNKKPVMQVPHATCNKQDDDKKNYKICKK